MQSDNGVRTSYDYDGAGQRRTQIVLNGVPPTTNTLNADGLVTATSESLGVSKPYISTFSYSADDPPVTATLNSGPNQV